MSDLKRERDAINAYSVIRDCFFPDSHAEALKFTLEMLERAATLPADPDGLEDMMQGKTTLLKEVWRKPDDVKA